MTTAINDPAQNINKITDLAETHPTIAKHLTAVQFGDIGYGQALELIVIDQAELLQQLQDAAQKKIFVPH